MTSSAALAANLPVFGGGAGAAPFTGTVQGNTTKVVTYAGSSPTASHGAIWDSNGNVTDSGGLPGATLFAATSTVTIANTGVETSLVGSGVGSMTLPANFLTAGKTIVVRVLGFHSSTATPTVRIKLKIQGVTVLDTGAQSTNNGTNTSIEVMAVVNCYTTGTSGTVWAQGYYLEAGQATFSWASTSTSTINTTLTALVDVTFQWGTASTSNTVTATNVLLRAE
jgi:hypothetical protein